MARDILFKAKRLDNGEWIEGHYYSQVYHKDTIEEDWYHFIKPLGSESWESVRVDPFTLCQYTGLTDKNGNKIWENDIFKHYNRVNFEDFEFHTIGLVEWDEAHCRYTNKKWKNNEIYVLNSECVYEVIGNSIDNPELLEVLS